MKSMVIQMYNPNPSIVDAERGKVKFKVILSYIGSLGPKLSQGPYLGAHRTEKSLTQV